MRHHISIAVLVLFIVCLCTPGFCYGELDLAQASSKDTRPAVTGSAGVGVYNQYIFRGYEIGRSGLVIEPFLSASYRGFTLTLWGNLDTNQRNTKTATFGHEFTKGWNETDLTFNYTYAIKKLSLTAGYIYYGTRYADETQEIFAAISYDTITRPTLTVYQDIDSYKGTYVNLSFAHSIPLHKIVALDLGASFGYFIGESDYWKTYDSSTGGYTGKEYQGFHDGSIKAGLSIAATKSLMIQPSVVYWFPLSGEAKREYPTPGADIKDSYNPNGPVKNNLVYGVSFTYSF